MLEFGHHGQWNHRSAVPWIAGIVVTVILAIAGMQAQGLALLFDVAEDVGYVKAVSERNASDLREIRRRVVEPAPPTHDSAMLWGRYYRQDDPAHQMIQAQRRHLLGDSLEHVLTDSAVAQQCP